MNDAELCRKWQSMLQKPWGDDFWKDLTPEELQEFINAGVNPNARDIGQGKDGSPSLQYSSSITPLHRIAQSNGNATIITMLINTGALVNAASNDGETPLHWATKGNENVEITRELIKGGANVNARNNRCQTPLHCVAQMGKNIEVIKEITVAFTDMMWDDIGDRADITAKDYDDKTPYDYLLENDALKDNEEAKALLKPKP